MRGANRWILVAGLGFALGVVAHAETKRQPTPPSAGQVSPTRVQPTAADLARNAEQGRRIQADVDKLLQRVQTLERRLQELEAHSHLYMDGALGATRTVRVSQILRDDGALDDVSVWIIDPGHGSSATKTRRTEGVSR